MKFNMRKNISPLSQLLNSTNSPTQNKKVIKETREKMQTLVGRLHSDPVNQTLRITGNVIRHIFSSVICHQKKKNRTRGTCK